MKKFKKWSKAAAAFAAAVCIALSPAAAVRASAAEGVFADVPEGHWAYDAVEYLAASGVISGYPDGGYGGGQAATRYELASCVARALEAVDREKADEESLRVLKKLCVEFSKELEALGARSEELGVRTAELEEGLGGWSFSGSLAFDANWGDRYSPRHTPAEGRNWNEFAEGSIGITKRFDDGSYVYARIALDRYGDGGRDEEFVMDRLFWNGYIGGAEITAGRFEFDWEGGAGLYHPGENGGWFSGFAVDGFKTSAWLGSSTEAEAVVARNISAVSHPLKEFVFDELDASLYAVKLEHYLSERAYFGVTGSFLRDDSASDFTPAEDFDLYGGWASWEFAPGAAVKGLYYRQELKNLDVSGQDAWKAVLEIDRSVLGFTSLWAEYGSVDEFFTGTQANAYNWSDGYASGIFKPWIADAEIILVRADQRYGFDEGRWGSFVRYAQADYDGADTVKNWTVGVTYQPNPALGFQLAYDEVDYGRLAGAFLNDPGGETKDRLVRFRTTLNF